MDKNQTIRELIIPDGQKGTRITIAKMWELVNNNYLDPHLRNIAMAIISKVPGKDCLGGANAIFEYVKRSITYRRDPEGAEWISDPFITLRDKIGDCDDQAILVSALSKAVGFPVRFVTVKTVDPEVYNHVFPEINVAGVWLAADTTEDRSYLGWHPKSVYGEKIWDDPIYKNITEGGYLMLAQYTMTAGESLVLQKTRELINRVNNWGWLTSGEKMRSDRDQFKVISADAKTYLVEPKKSYVVGLADTMWDGYSAFKDAGNLQSVYIRNLKRIETIIPTQPAEVTKIIKEFVEVPAAPPVTPAPLAPGVPAPPVPKKILGMAPLTAVIAGGVVVLGGVYYFFIRKKR